MSVTAVIKKNSYFDSVSLMSISTKANGLDGVGQAFVAMATEMNKGVLQNLGLLTPELAEAGNGDLMIVVVPAPGADAEAVIPQIEELLTRRAPAGGGAAISYRTIAAAAQADPGANLAIIAVNGAYAAREARKALDNGLNVMMFSDNVPVEEEIALKALAHGKGLLMMGPDCGTAIINNVALCFGNAVRPGPVGIVAASGTGSQEVSVRIHALGGGISQLIGTGGRDLSAEVGGVMMIDGIRALAADPKTEAIVLVSKPPAPEVEKKVLAEIAGAGKPVVVYFIGGSEEAVTTAGGTFAASSLDAALAAVRLTGLPSAQAPATDTAHIESVRARLTPEQTNIRGLFCGGTLCDESMYALLNAGEEVWSNIQKDPEFVLGAADPSRGHTFLDFGDDEFTNGRPHPMIDPSNRLARLVEEAKDPSVAAIVMDFVLGFGAHEDPVGVTLPAITEARKIAADAGRHLEIVAYVLGTDRDTPGLAAQTAALVAAGVTITTSSTATGEFARAIVREGIKA
ncbi:acyl-CoA synthetase FdrA [Arthrobacter cupressi]|uniref:Succinyl-CoA synthetase, alpha subunit n=1 Tax=Arthrobacter cupressi TaxID=1045773 RepID=A0A1G8Q955_9MICC|nr:acyl-CoA synthetase FdrA [Arthrobacter cupressi]NYD78066.1 succinyl-CoA synthetase alpha subunit [Arthrobacter cupressi]SDJ01231.1 Succinyl-CoA synthetase, alpha subunit [Arthrobacter cupressi]